MHSGSGRLAVISKFELRIQNVILFPQKSGGKLAANRMELGDDDEPVKKKRKIVSRAVRPTLGNRFKGIDTSEVTKVFHEDVLRIWPNLL